MRKPERLSSVADFKTLFGRGRRIDSPLFRVVVYPNRLPLSRFAFVIPRAIEKRAAVRNRLRRRAREWIRLHPALFAQSVDCVIMFKKGAAGATRKNFYEELRKTINRLSL